MLDFNVLTSRLALILKERKKRQKSVVLCWGIAYSLKYNTTSLFFNEANLESIKKTE